MTEIIDFTKETMKRETSSENIVTLKDGSTWFKYSMQYNFDCKEGEGVPEYILKSQQVVFPNVRIYDVEFFAQNDEEARQRVEAIKLNAKLIGRILE